MTAILDASLLLKDQQAAHHNMEEEDDQGMCPYSSTWWTG